MRSCDPAPRTSFSVCLCFLYPWCKIRLCLTWNDQLPAVSKPSLSWSNHVEYGAGLNWSTSYQLFQNQAWAGQTMLSMELVWTGQPATSCFKTKLELVKPCFPLWSWSELVNQLPAVSKPSLSWSNHVEYGACLNWSTSYQLFQNQAWAGQTMLSMELVGTGQPATSFFKTKLELVKPCWVWNWSELVNQLPAISKPSLSWSNHVEYGAGGGNLSDWMHICPQEHDQVRNFEYIYHELISGYTAHTLALFLAQGHTWPYYFKMLLFIINQK